MSEIRLLDNSTINKIAAGEVVDRPASVVKELVENSIDAGATQITVEIKDGGTSYIRVTDNGCGISRKNIELAFLRHATSKIASSDDLDGVRSLGFRGEALASVAAVARVEIATKTAEDITAGSLWIDGGQIVKHGESGGVVGTSLTVRNLFFNTPARRKFLKSTRAESGAVSDIVGFVALSQPDIAVKYINNGQISFQTGGSGDLQTAVMQIFGIHVAKNLIEVDFQGNGIELTGVLGKPDIARGNRTYEMFFVNGRYVRSYALSRVAESAYKALSSGRFPFFVLHLRLDPTNIDVNVHPTKLEVRFSDEMAVFQAVEKAVGEALADSNLIPEVRLGRASASGGLPFVHPDIEAVTKATQISIEEAAPNRKATYGRKRVSNPLIVKEPSKNTHIWIAEEPLVIEAPEPLVVAGIEEAKHGDNLIKQETSYIIDKHSFFYDYTIIGQLFATYWIVEQNGSMYMIDQHAAHERILYEEILCSSVMVAEPSQAFLEPIVFELTESEDAVLAASIGGFERLGFEIEPFGVRTYMVRCVPMALLNVVNTGFFAEVLGRLAGYKDVPDVVPAMLLQQIAMQSCKAAVTGNDKLNTLECRELIAKLQTLENPFTCPHGRPTVIEITRNEIERKFKRG
ncbi:MAG: DNA mismatch repair endonuclease MutL [Defluviitaleaceae bacterium]|nr:DNA mismatch repair endonuclease MutL [Defluviitaleaceae bacterium]